MVWVKFSISGFRKTKRETRVELGEPKKICMWKYLGAKNERETGLDFKKPNGLQDTKQVA